MEILSDNEEDEGQPNETVLQDDYGLGEEYSDRDAAVYHQEYDDGGEETGSESEEEGRGSSPLQNDGNALRDERDELDDEPEIIAVDSDDEEAGQDGEFLEGEGQTRPQLSLSPDEPENDVLPGSSPILSSPIEPALTPGDPDYEIYDVDELEEDEENVDDETQLFDWDHPPAFEQGVPASGSGHLEFPVEHQVLESEEDSPAMAVFGTSDALPTFQPQPQTESDIENWPSNEHEEPVDDITEPVSVDSKQEYSVIEEDEDSAPDEIHEGFDAYTVSRHTSVDPQQCVLEDESLWGHETEPRGMSIDIVTVDDEPDREPLVIDDEVVAADEALDDAETRSASPPKDAESQIPEGPEVAEEAAPAEIQDSAFPPEDVIDPSLAHGQSQESHPHPDDTVNTPSFGEGIQVVTPHQGTSEPSTDTPLAADAVQSNGHEDNSVPSEIPMPVSADPAVHDPYEDSSPHLLAGPAAFLKQMQRPDSGLFTPPSEIPSAAPTPPVIQDETEGVAENGLEEIVSEPVQDEDSQVQEGAMAVDSTPIAEPLEETIDAPALAAPEITDLSSEQDTDQLDSNSVPLFSAPRVLEVDPYPYSLSTPGEHLESSEREISTVSSQETSSGDAEEITQGDAIRPVDEMELAYPDGSEVVADDTPDWEVVDDETDADGDDDPEYVDSNSSMAGGVDDVEQLTDEDSSTAKEELTLDVEVAEEANVVPTVDESGLPSLEAGGDEGADDVEQISDEASFTLKEELTLNVEEVIREEETDVIPADDNPVLPCLEAGGDAVVDDVEQLTDEASFTLKEELTLDVEVVQEEEAKIPADDVFVLPDDESALPSLEAGGDVSIAEEPREVEESTTQPTEEPESSTQDIQGPKEELPGTTDRIPLEATEIGSPVVVETQVPQMEPAAAESASRAPSPTESSRKRKRDESLTEFPSTSGNSGKIAESRLSRRYTSKGKGKAKEEIDDDTSSSTSSASSAARMLNPESSSSRASSVVSIIRASRPLPSPPKYPPAPPAPPPPPPLMHAHSRPVIHRHGTSLARQSSSQRLTPSRNSFDMGSPTASTSSMQMPTLPLRPTPGGSPVTRANCRYHKISLPEDKTDDNSMRAWFLVPGCSLGNKTVMDEEDVKDEGDPTPEDAKRSIADVESLMLDAGLMSALRLLVGFELLREQEVFYVPRPDEHVRASKHRRRESKLRISSGSFASESAPMSPRSPASTSTRPPNSSASTRPPNSSSTSSVQARHRKKSERESRSPPAWSQDGVSTDEDESPADKSIREAEAEGIAAAASDTPVRTRRRKRIDKGAAEYKPPDDLGAIQESSDDEGGKARRKKKKSNARGVKRRQSEAIPSQEGGEDRKTKKLKTEDSTTGSTL
ncbi:hypothetical protein FB45DRAFT_894063 [Roridomyces roridus]|uniref:Uncharacterized protein n=1 Tax=Roridomyces roridus TaxID=1738132 RepID=A0AAD7FWY5_9AGAR|nr:hypothetical protein FB45DRAFT_894063 [Roridomyces roridus]